MMEYQGYVGRITSVDEEQGTFHGEVAGIADVVTFEGATAAELAQAFRESVDDYLDYCRERQEAANRPDAATLEVRLPDELQRRATAAARQAGQSLDVYIAAAIEEFLALRHPKRAAR